MGNLLKKISPEKYTLLENNDEILHNIETNTESIENIKNEFSILKKNNNDNFDMIQNDMEKMTTYIKNIKQDINYLSNHQSSSRYGGFSSGNVVDSVDGPLATMFSTSE